MYRLSLIILTAIIMLFMTSPIQAPVLDATPGPVDSTAVVNDIVADFAILASLLNKAEPRGEYLVIDQFPDHESAAAYLTAGFEGDLARQLAAFLLTYSPDIERLVVVPTEFIPMITAVDLPCLQVRHISPETVVVSRCYDDCYQPGDRYCYTIKANLYGEHWIISDLQLAPDTRK